MELFSESSKADFLKSYYEQLYTLEPSNQPSMYNDFADSIAKKLDADQAQKIACPFTILEVEDAVFQLQDFAITIPLHFGISYDRIRSTEQFFKMIRKSLRRLCRLPSKVG